MRHQNIARARCTLRTHFHAEKEGREVVHKLEMGLGAFLEAIYYFVFITSRRVGLPAVGATALV